MASSTDPSDFQDVAEDMSHMPAGATFYLKLEIGNADGTIDLHGETPQASMDFDVTIKIAMDNAQDTGMDSYVYECVPIRKAMRGKVRVTAIK